MADKPDDLPESIIIDRFAGLRNTVSEERLAPGELSAAVNIDLDDSGQARSRRGYVKRADGRFHSLKHVAGHALVVRDGVLGTIDTQYNFAGLQQVGDDKVSYTEVSGTIYFSNGTASGKIVDGQVQPWGELVSPGRWISPVMVSSETLGKIAGKLYGAPPLATEIEAFNGRIYCAVENVLWFTELFLYDQVDKTKNFIQFEHKITMLAAVDDGLYVGTEGGLFFLSGTAARGLKQTKITTEQVVRGSCVRVQADQIHPNASRAAIPKQKALAFLAADGVHAAFNGGEVHDLTRGRVLLPEGKYAAGLLREQDGMSHYIATLDTGGTPTAGAAIGDYIEAEIRRFQPRAPMVIEAVLAETLRFAEMFIDGGETLTAEIVEGVTLSSAIAPAAIYTISMAEGLGISGSVATGAVLIETLTEGLLLSEAAVDTTTYNITVAEGLQIGGNTGTGAVLSDVLSEGFSVAAAMTQGAVYAGSLIDIMTLSDALVSTGRFAGLLTETLGVGEAASAEEGGTPVTDLYPDHFAAFDPVNSFYKVDTFVTNDLAAFLARSEVLFASDPTSAIDSSGYTPSAAHELRLSLGVSTAWTIYGEAEVPASDGSTYHSLMSLANSANGGDFVEVVREGFSLNARVGVRDGFTGVGTDANFDEIIPGTIDQFAMVADSGGVRVFGDGRLGYDNTDAGTLIAENGMDQIKIGYRGSPWGVPIKRILVKKTADSDTVAAKWTDTWTADGWDEAWATGYSFDNGYATCVGNAGDSLRSLKPRSTGKWYGEVKVPDDAPSGAWVAGLCLPSMPHNNPQTGVDVVGVLYDTLRDVTGDQVWYFMPGMVTGRTLQIAVDCDTGKFWMRTSPDGSWNARGDTTFPETGEDSFAAGTAVHMFASAGSTGSQFVVRTQLEDFEFNPPAGFNAWDDDSALPSGTVFEDTLTEGVALAAETDAEVPVAQRFMTIYTNDIDPANERDDESQIAVMLANQDIFDIRGLIADAPDGVNSGFTALLNAYNTDYAKVSSYGTAGQFKTLAQLNAMLVQGPNVDSPSRGYYISGDTQFAQAEAAADAIIAAAADADPSGTYATNPYGKLHVISGGAGASIAQALYKAVILGGMPDFCDRVVWHVQSKHNSYVIPNTWKYIMSKHWQAAGVPGDFGDLMIINPCWQTHALNNEGNLAQEVWTYAKGSGAMGAALETERAASNYTNEYLRAGDAWLNWFLYEAHTKQIFDPTSTATSCGRLRTSSNGTRYPWVTGAWGPSNAAGGWSTTGTTDSPYSPNHYIPEAGVDSISTALSAVVIYDWYDWALTSLGRYRKANAFNSADAAKTNEWVFADGSSGQTAANTVSGKQTLRLGSGTGADAADPAWVTGGVNILSGDYLYGANDTQLNGNLGHTWVAMVKLNAVAGAANQTIVGRDASGNNATRQFQLRFVNGVPNIFWRYGASISSTSVSGVVPATAGEWMLVVGQLTRSGELILRVDGVEVGRAQLGGTPNTGDNYAFTVGGRDGSDSLNGVLGYLGHFAHLSELQLREAEEQAVTAFLAAHPSETYELPDLGDLNPYNVLALELEFDEGAGTPVDTSLAPHAMLTNTGGWVAGGYEVETGEALVVDNTNAIEATDFMAIMSFTLNTISGASQQLMGMDVGDSTVRRFQWRVNADGTVTFYHRYGASLSTSVLTTTTPLTAGVPYIMAIRLRSDRTMHLWNKTKGDLVTPGLLAGTPNSGDGCDLGVGSRADGTTPLRGVIHYAAYAVAPSLDMEQALLDHAVDKVFTKHGITL